MGSENSCDLLRDQVENRGVCGRVIWVGETDVISTSGPAVGGLPLTGCTVALTLSVTGRSGIASNEIVANESRRISGLAVVIMHDNLIRRLPKKTSMYRSQYENEYGELWVFVYDYSGNTGILTGADVNWQDYPVVDGRAIGLLLNDGELVWLRSVWESAIKGPQNPDRSNGGSASEQHDSRPLH